MGLSALKKRLHKLPFIPNVDVSLFLRPQSWVTLSPPETRLNHPLFLASKLLHDIKTKTMTLNRLILLAFLMLGSYAFAQKSTVDQRLLSHFSQEQISEMQKKAPETLAFWEYYLEKGYHVTQFNPTKHTSIDGEMEIPSTIDLFKMKIFPKQNEASVFIDKLTNQVLTVYSMDAIVAKLNYSKSKK